MAEILNNSSMYHLLQSDFYQQPESKVFSLFNSFSTSKFFDLFAVIFLLTLDNLASKSDFVIKLARANLALKTSAAKVLNSGVVIYF